MLHDKHQELDRARNDEVNEALERFSARALHRVRDEGIFDRRVVLLQSCLFSGTDEWLLSAKHFNDPDTLEMFRRQLGEGAE